VVCFVQHGGRSQKLTVEGWSTQGTFLVGSWVNCRLIGTTPGQQDIGRGIAPGVANRKFALGGQRKFFQVGLGSQDRLSHPCQATKKKGKHGFELIGSDGMVHLKGAEWNSGWAPRDDTIVR